MSDDFTLSVTEWKCIQLFFSFHVAFKFLQTLYMYNTVQVMSQQHQVITYTGSLSMSLQEQISTKL